MKGHRLEVADVFHAHEDEFLQRWGHVLSDQQRKVLHDIGLCRTAALGTHLERFDRCSSETVAYDSCRNRHCPKCQSSARDRWLIKQASSLLPVPYAHVVFTVPEQLAPLAFRNQRLFYSLLFRAASETLLEIAADARRLGARIGVLAVLHTWSQNLQHHPHLHCLVPAGGLALDNSRWVATRRGFFLPCACSAACSAASCSPSSNRATGATNYASPASWPNSPRNAHFTLCSIPCADESGWSP
jgi:Transposase zinc-binding domain/Putative transposase